MKGGGRWWKMDGDEKGCVETLSLPLHPSPWKAKLDQKRWESCPESWVAVIYPSRESSGGTFFVIPEFRAFGGGLPICLVLVQPETLPGLGYQDSGAGQQFAKFVLHPG